MPFGNFASESSLCNSSVKCFEITLWLEAGILAFLYREDWRILCAIRNGCRFVLRGFPLIVEIGFLCPVGGLTAMGALDEVRHTMGFDIKSLIRSRHGENYALHRQHVNRTLVKVQQTIGFDKIYERAEGAYLYDSSGNAYLDFLSGYSVFNIGRNHPVVKQAIRDVLELDLPNMVQMDCSLLSGLLAEKLVEITPPHLDAVFFTNSVRNLSKAP